MISTLHIKNIGIIEDLVIDFNDGFNVLTGETEKTGRKPNAGCGRPVRGVRESRKGNGEE